MYSRFIVILKEYPVASDSLSHSEENAVSRPTPHPTISYAGIYRTADFHFILSGNQTAIICPVIGNLIARGV